MVIEVKSPVAVTSPPTSVHATTQAEKSLASDDTSSDLMQNSFVHFRQNQMKLKDEFLEQREFL